MNQYYIFLILLTYAPLVLTQLNLGGLLPSILGGQQVQQQGLSTNSGYPQPTNAIPGAGGGIPGIYGNTEMGAGVPGASGFQDKLAQPQAMVYQEVDKPDLEARDRRSANRNGRWSSELSSLLGGQGGGAGIPNLSSLLGGQQTGSATGLPDLSSF
uniref:Uncharacterized protein n=1 Tax=Ditylenchus dipsaci TaxID=166011 RepID=A0A915EDJ8_9BILA